MAHQASHRRILAAPDSMDPTPRKPKPNPSSGAGHRHRHPDPSTIQSISHRFSKLYTNNRKLASKPHPHPQPDPNLHDTSCATLTKSSSQHGSVFSAPEKNQLVVSSKINDDLDAEKEKIGRNCVSSIPPSVNGGRRRSFCSSQVELADFLSCSGVKVVAVDMPPFMQIHAVNCARKARDSLEKFTSKTLAFTLKKEFDGVYGPAWHCIVGTSFGSFVTHSVGGFMYFSMDQKLYILLFKTAVQRAE
ncbi:uncharacterized protein LOC131021258 [Salvia miltiorrhiza]|uniref:uncharacterized protein LOC131021258 n=1 Tax=Salvia miltiorrhiza TaxID=226208 RepID=UPI0025AD7E24|nr:uncharacterized protein LOC131021258 [Salvia miltiorrhiza]